MSRTLALISGLFATVGLSGCTSEAPAIPPVRRAGSDAPFQHVVLVVIDTLRADVARTAHTPNMDALAAAGERVDRAWSSGTWTAPSVVSLFTGAPIRAHGWDLPVGHIGRYPTLPTRPTLAETLQGAGFHTTALVGNPYLTAEVGFARGFDRWSRTSDTAMLRTLEHAFLPQLDAGGRHFLYLHLMGPHSPLAPSSEARTRHGLASRWFQEPRGLMIGAAKRNQQDGVRTAYATAYRAVVEDTDARLGRILQALTPLGTDTLIILTSDHGELLGEHGMVGHGRHLWEPLTHVPLIVRGVQDLPHRMSIDAIPDLVTRLTGVPASWPTQAVAGSVLVSQREGLLTMSPDGRTKWIWGELDTESYDLEQDPAELVPLSADPRAARFRATWESQVPAGPVLPLTVDLSKDTRSALKTLGYTD